IATEDPIPPHLANPEVPAELSRLVLQMLKKEPRDRPSAADAALALHRFARTVEKPASQGVRLRTWPAAVGVGIVLLTLAVIAWVFRPRSEEPPFFGAQPGDAPPFQPQPNDPPNGLAVAAQTQLAALNRSHIPVDERFDWQPEELLAVLGEHRSWHDGLH